MPIYESYHISSFRSLRKFCDKLLFLKHLLDYKVPKIRPIDSWNFLQKCVLDVLVVFRLDLGQISFNPVEKAFETQLLAFLATSITFHHIVTQACAEIKILNRVLQQHCKTQLMERDMLSV